MYKIKKSSNPAKNTAWKNFSRYIRLRDAIKTTGTKTHAKCITCGAMKPIEEMDAGHAIPGRHNAVLFSEDLCHAQCRACNRAGGGELQAYRMILTDVHGAAWWEFWQDQKKKSVFYSPDDFKRISEEYKKKWSRLIKGEIQQ
jgi:NAD-dependent dihydropyrimidine dehydrogenase PreA subunit